MSKEASDRSHSRILLASCLVLVLCSMAAIYFLYAGTNCQLRGHSLTERAEGYPVPVDFRRGFLFATADLCMNLCRGPGRRPRSACERGRSSATGSTGPLWIPARHIFSCGSSI